MSERETRPFITPGGHKAVLYAYLTGRESKAVEAVMYGEIKMDPSQVETGADGRPKVKVQEVSGEFLIKQEQKLVGTLLVSLDGETESALERLLDLPASEYDAVKAEVDNITNPTTPETSEQLGADTSQTA